MTAQQLRLNKSSGAQAPQQQLRSLGSTTAQELSTKAQELRLHNNSSGAQAPQQLRNSDSMTAQELRLKDSTAAQAPQ